jgi:hypothetical protein
MIIFRAMCEKEFLLTVEYNKPIFVKKYKWFSENLQWIKERVCGGNFNDSDVIKNRYIYIVYFFVNNLEKFIKLNSNELMIKENYKKTIIPINYIKI